MDFAWIASRFGKPGYIEDTPTAPWTPMERRACANCSSCLLLSLFFQAGYRKSGGVTRGSWCSHGEAASPGSRFPPSVISGAGMARLPGCFQGIISFKQFPTAAHQFTRCHLEMAARDSVWLRSPFCTDQGQGLTKT